MNWRKERKAAKALRSWAANLGSKYSKENKREFIERLKSKPTQSELRVIQYLTELKVPFGFQKKRGPFVADFYFKHWRMILEIDGSFHDKRKFYDDKRDQYCRDLGWKVLRIKNEQTQTMVEFLRAVEPIVLRIKRSGSKLYKPVQKRLAQIEAYSDSGSLNRLGGDDAAADGEPELKTVVAHG